MAACRASRRSGARSAVARKAAAFRGQDARSRSADRRSLPAPAGGQPPRSRAKALLDLAISQAAVGRTEAARAGLERVQAHDMITDGATDEVVALAAFWATPNSRRRYMDRAVQHMSARSRRLKRLTATNAPCERSRALACVATRRRTNSRSWRVTTRRQEQRVRCRSCSSASETWEAAIAAFNTMIGFAPDWVLSPLIGIATSCWGVRTPARDTSMRRARPIRKPSDLEGRRR